MLRSISKGTYDLQNCYPHYLNTNNNLSAEPQYLMNVSPNKDAAAIGSEISPSKKYKIDLLLLPPIIR